MWKFCKDADSESSAAAQHRLFTKAVIMTLTRFRLQQQVIQCERLNKS